MCCWLRQCRCKFEQTAGFVNSLFRFNFLSHSLTTFRPLESCCAVPLSVCVCLFVMVQRRHGRRSALAFVFYASAFGWCFVEQCKSGPCPLLRSWSGPVRAALGERRGGGSSFWAAVQNAASNNKTDAETYITEAKKRAGQHMSSSQLVDRDAAVHALIQSIEETGLLTVVLGARMWAKRSSNRQH